MIGSSLSMVGRNAGTKLLTGTLMLVIGAFCLQSIIVLNNTQARISASERELHNSSASALYVRLATLEQPASKGDITRILRDFIRNDDRVKGTTLLDAEGLLVAQLGTGNDSLLQHPTSTPIARIPIRSTDRELYGHAIVAFRPAQHRLNRVGHYMALTTASAILTLVAFGMLRMYWQLSGAMLMSVRSAKADRI
ncbi:MAG: hypothetical protein AB8B87_00330 [Granulosicoccus sp.]